MDTYNGWKNHATWVVNLWLTNTEGAYKSLQEILTSASESDFDKAKELEDFVTEVVVLEKGNKLDSRGERWGVGIREDFNGSINRNLNMVDWLEIVQSNYEQ